MQWIKSHLHVVICLALGAAALALIVFGMLDGSVAVALEKDIGQVRGLQGIQPANRQHIEAAKKQLAATRKQVQAAQEQVQAIAAHTPLIDGLFPGATNLSIRLKFREALKNKYENAFLRQLNAKDKPDIDEITFMKKKMEDDKKKAETQRNTGRGGSGPGLTGRVTRRGDSPVAGTPEEQVEQDAGARISVMRARQIYCYAGPESFDRHDQVLDSDRPKLNDMWYAQMSLWIQEDMVQALAGLNQREAEALPEKDRWVGHLPVKRLEQIRDAALGAHAARDINGEA